jgi:hypothetical protein
MPTPPKAAGAYLNGQCKLKNKSNLPVVLPFALDFTVDFPLLYIVALVIFGFSPGQAELHFDLAVLEIKPQGDQGEAFLLDLADQPLDLVPVKKELAVMHRLMVEPVRHLVNGDVHAGKVYLVVLHARVRFLDAGLFLAYRLHFASNENNSRLEGLDYLVIKTRLFIPGYFYEGIGHTCSRECGQHDDTRMILASRLKCNQLFNGVYGEPGIRINRFAAADIFPSLQVPVL